MTQSPRPAGSLFRKIVAVVVLVPLAIVIIAFAMANRESITVSFDPFSAQHPASSVTLPLFALVFVLLILGVLIGGIAGWLRHGRWRRTARRLEREAAVLRGEIASIRHRHQPPVALAPAEPSERLKLGPPVR